MGWILELRIDALTLTLYSQPGRPHELRQPKRKGAAHGQIGGLMEMRELSPFLGVNQTRQDAVLAFCPTERTRGISTWALDCRDCTWALLSYVFLSRYLSPSLAQLHTLSLFHLARSFPLFFTPPCPLFLLRGL